ncbi:hypothetical protein D9M68_697490 [compost metagenome]
MACTGATGNCPGANAAAAWPTIRARGVSPDISACRCRVSTSAAAPSDIEEAFPAVTVPSGVNTGFKPPSREASHKPGVSSSAISATSGTPRRALAAMGAISAAKCPAAMLCWARSTLCSA